MVACISGQIGVGEYMCMCRAGGTVSISTQTL